MRRIHLNNIEIVKKINREFLKSEDYFQSLLEEGFRVNLLTTNEVESIQTDCLLLLSGRELNNLARTLRYAYKEKFTEDKTDLDEEDSLE